MNEQNEVQKINGTWNGMPCSIKKVWGTNTNWEGHEFSAEECAKLFNDETIEFEAISKTGKAYTAKGKLEKQSFTDDNGNEHEYVGFTLKFDNKPKDDVERFSGTWNGKQVNIKRVWGKNDFWDGHRFSDDEVAVLLDGQNITFKAVSKQNKEYTAKGKLADQSFTDKATGKVIQYVGFTLVFD